MWIFHVKCTFLLRVSKFQSHLHSSGQECLPIMNTSSNDALKIYTGNVITHFSHASEFESSSYKNLKQKVTCTKWLLSTNLRQTKACQFGWNKPHYTPMRMTYNCFIDGKSTLVNGCMHIIHACRMSNVKCAEVCNLYDWVRTIGGRKYRWEYNACMM